MAAGCPGCLSYVLVMKNNPKCPRCSSVVPLPLMKKPRIDLNISIWMIKEFYDYGLYPLFLIL